MARAQGDQLVARAQAGDEAAWAELYGDHAERLVVWLRHLPHRDPAADAEDIAAEAWLTAARRLVLAPLDLDVLGLQIHLDRVVLNNVAVSGAGNLLGNLLCAVTGLLDGVGGLGQLAALLNRILTALGLG